MYLYLLEFSLIIFNKSERCAISLSDKPVQSVCMHCLSIS